MFMLGIDRIDAMAGAFASLGGTVAADDLVRLLRGRVEQPLSTVARWIVGREVVSFEAQSRTLLPLFQFDLAAASVRAPVAKVVRELAGVFDDWELACWFIEPNAWLDDAAPANRVHADPDAVLAAARADRFVATL